MRSISALVLAAISIAVASIPPKNDLKHQHFITRDVAIIGGGSAGTYAAIRLRQMNQSVVVIEKEDNLGGHVDTYTDPATGAAVDFGVLVYEDLPLVRSYFGHFNITLVKVAVAGNATQVRADLRTGTLVGPPPGGMLLALLRYTAQLTRYPWLNTGFNLPDPVPEDLLLPFGEFIRKHQLDGAVDIIAQFNQGVGDILNQTTIYMLKYFGLDVVQGLATGFVQAASHNNSELYGAAERELGPDALLNSQVVNTSSYGDEPWTYLEVASGGGVRIVRARRVIVAIPPKSDLLQALNPDERERRLFDQFQNTCYYATLAKIPGFPPNTMVVNRANETPYQLPPQPSIYLLSPKPGHLTSILYGSETPMTEAQVKQDITQRVLTLRNAGMPVDPPQFVAYSNHTPFLLTVSPDAIRNGFYDELNDLQGHRRRYYMSATMNTHDSAQIWTFIEHMLTEHFE